MVNGKRLTHDFWLASSKKPKGFLVIEKRVKEGENTEITEYSGKDYDEILKELYDIFLTK